LVTGPPENRVLFFLAFSSGANPALRRPYLSRCVSPSNPNQRLRRAEKKLTEKMDIRCTVEEKQLIREKAALAGLPVSGLLREQLDYSLHSR